MTLSIALNYCELATTYPVTGGAMTYVEEGYGNGLLMFWLALWIAFPAPFTLHFLQSVLQFL